jgi:hypothetical protein
MIRVKKKSVSLQCAAANYKDLEVQNFKLEAIKKYRKKELYN